MSTATEPNVRIGTEANVSIGTEPNGSTAPAPKVPKRRVTSDKLASVGLPILATLLILGLWWGLTVAFSVPEYLVPGPQVVVERLIEFWPYLLEQTWVTLGETVAGFALAILVGVPVAMAIARSKILEYMIYPLLLALNSIPKVAIAPILVVWMGFGMTPKVVMVVLLCFFPIVLSTVAGLRSTPSELVDLSKSLDAREYQEFIKIRFPWALPQIFTGLKTAISFAVIGAVIAEFVGASKGLGYVIVQSGSSANTALAFAAIVLLAVISIALFYIIALIERLVLPWAEANRGRS